MENVDKCQQGYLVLQNSSSIEDTYFKVLWYIVYHMLICEIYYGDNLKPKIRLLINRQIMLIEVMKIRSVFSCSICIHTSHQVGVPVA